MASLWSVSDVATSLLMQQFHRNLYTDGMEKASALRAAQIWLRDLNSEEALALLEAKQGELMVPESTVPRMAAMDAVQAQFHVQDRGSRPFAHPFY